MRTNAGRLTAVGARARATVALGAAPPVRLAPAQERFDALAGVGGGFEPAGRRSLPIVALGFPAVFMRGKVFLVSGLADVAVATGWGALCPLRHAGRGIRPGSIPGAAHSNRIMAGYRRLPACLCRSGAAFLKAEWGKVLLGVGG